jgi:hypothetical protein
MWYAAVGEPPPYITMNNKSEIDIMMHQLLWLTLGPCFLVGLIGTLASCVKERSDTTWDVQRGQRQVQKGRL